MVISNKGGSAQPDIAALPILGLELGERLSQPTTNVVVNEIGTKRLEKWQSGFAVKENLLKERLAHEGINETDLLHLLSEDGENLLNRIGKVPAWLELFTGLYRNFESPSDDAVAPGFAKLFEPLLVWGRDTLTARLTDLKNTGGLGSSEELLDLLYVGLPQKLANNAARILTLELHVAGLQELLTGDSPEERFESFIIRLSEPDLALQLFAEYPVLARHALTCVEQWIEANYELVQRLSSDMPKLTEFVGHDLGLLTHVDGGAGDKHKGGRSVFILTFGSGVKLAYKPRSLDIDEHFGGLIKWLNAKGDHPPLLTPKLINKGDYGWTEFIEKAECKTEEEIKRFYERQGAFLALFHGLHATDFHHENLIAAGEHPVPIDLESIFHPTYVSVNSDQQSAGRAMEKLSNSVLAIGMLPQRSWANVEDKRGIDMSGLGGNGGQLSAFKLPAYDNLGTDKMVFVRKRYPMEESQNLPKLNGEGVYLLKYEADLIRGFTQTYQLLTNHREELIETILPTFEEDEIRYIARGTAYYDLRLKESFHPDLQRDALDRLKFFDNLWLHISNVGLEKLVRSEINDLIKGDIPYFSTRPGSLDVFDSKGQKIPKLFAKSGLQNTANRLTEFGEADMAYQLWIIRSSLATLFMGKENDLNYASGVGPRLNVEVPSFLDGAKAVGERLLELAVSSEEDIAWLGVSLIDEKSWHLQAIGPSLYDGISGVTLFMAYLGELTEDDRYREAARQGLMTVQAHNKHILETLDESVADWPLGVFGNPLTSAIYVQTHLAVLWNRPELLDEIEDFIEPLMTTINKDDVFDVVGGTAGLLLALLTLHSVRPHSKTLDVAILCGEHLIEHAIKQEAGLAWLTSNESEQPLAGISHGASGIGMALIRLADITGREDFLTTGLAATDYERSIFSDEHQNWPDFRELDGVVSNKERNPYSMQFWCHGAPGVGMARADMLRYVSNDALLADLQIAISSTITEGFGSNHSLCHGDLGNADFLLTASQYLDDEPLRLKVYEMAEKIIEDINGRGGLCGVPLGAETPGLMTGIAGIGYGLLRFHNPDLVPSVLLLEPPIKREMV